MHGMVQQSTNKLYLLIKRRYPSIFSANHHKCSQAVQELCLHAREAGVKKNCCRLKLHSINPSALAP